MKTVLKILAVLAAIAGVVYVIATYGERIVAWCRNLLSTVCWEDCCDDDCCCDDDDCCCVEDVQADEADFAG